MNAIHKTLTILCLTALVLFHACKEKNLPESPSVIYGRDGDTCQLSKVYLTQYDFIEYQYTNRMPRKITLHLDGSGTFANDLTYDAQGRLQKVTGEVLNATYEYDDKGRVIRENRNLEGSVVLAPHYSARIFEYNQADQVVKCSYVEGKGSEYSTSYVKKGDMYRYESYAYDVQGDVFSMVAYEREPKDEKFRVVADYTYFYDQLINPFYGHPGVFDYPLYFGYDSGNAPAVFSKHNLVRVVKQGVSASSAYTYTDTRYPRTAMHVLAPNGYFLDGIDFEYVNCK